MSIFARSAKKNRGFNKIIREIYIFCPTSRGGGHSPPLSQLGGGAWSPGVPPTCTPRPWRGILKKLPSGKKWKNEEGKKKKKEKKKEKRKENVDK